MQAQLILESESFGIANFIMIFFSLILEVFFKQTREWQDREKSATLSRGVYAARAVRSPYFEGRRPPLRSLDTSKIAWAKSLIMK